MCTLQILYHRLIILNDKTSLTARFTISFCGFSLLFLKLHISLEHDFACSEITLRDTPKYILKNIFYNCSFVCSVDKE